MAIVIPSKNIYGSPQVAKVRDNIIERIEVRAVEVIPDNEYDTTVYNEDILLKQNTSTTETNSQKEKLDYDVVNDPIAPSVINRYWAYAFLDSNAEYYVGTIEIQRIKNNKYISTVNYGTDKWKIESNLVLSKTTYPITGSVVVKNYDEITSKSVSPSDGVSEIVYDFPSMPTTVREGLGGAEAELLGVSNATNLTVSYEENEDRFTISYKILKKLSETKYVGANMSQSSDATIAVNGEKTEYNAEKIEITVYGNTIGIDLTDKTVYIPEADKTSKKLHSIDGNELMQTTNTTGGIEKWVMVQGTDYSYEIVENPPIAPYSVTLPDTTIRINFLTDKAIKAKKTIYLRNGTSYFVDAGVPTYSVSGKVLVKEIHGEVGAIVPAITGLYEKTKEQYALGKETATIRCSINDYFDENKTIKKSISKLPVKTWDFINVSVKAAELASTFSATISFFPIEDINIKISYKGGSILDEEYAKIVIKKGEKRGITQVFAKVVSFDVISITPEITVGNEIDMVFKIGDKVIPMVYGADGQDHPMSLYKDGSAKIFQVLGTKIYYDGAVWQELSLQEI